MTANDAMSTDQDNPVSSSPEKDASELQTMKTHDSAAPGSPAPLHAHAQTPPEGDALTALILDHLEEGKAEDVRAIDLTGKSSFAESMIIATGRSNRQVAALADRLMRAGKDIGFGRVNAEGLPQADWVLLDFGGCIVHLFRPEVRAFYNLEKMWGAGSAPSATMSDRGEDTAQSLSPL